MEVSIGDALLEASKNGDAVITRSLLDRGADVEARDWEARTPLHLASANGHLDVVSLLLEKGAQVKSIDQDGNTALHIACCRGNSKLVKHLLTQDVGAKIPNKEAKTPLHVASESGHPVVMGLLLEHDPDSSAVDRDGNTALHFASRRGVLKAVVNLLNKGADVQVANNKEQTPLHLASETGSPHVVLLLLEKGADVTAVDQDGNTALHMSSSRGSLQVVELLLSKGAVLEAKNKDGNTALHMSSSRGSLQVVKRLLSAGAVLNAVNKEAKTPLQLASENGNPEVISLLLEKSTDATAFRERPLDLQKQVKQTVSESSGFASKVQPESMGATASSSDQHLSVDLEDIVKTQGKDLRDNVCNDAYDDTLKQHTGIEDMTKGREADAMHSVIERGLEDFSSTEFSIMRVEQPLLVQAVLEEFDEGTIYLHPQRICVHTEHSFKVPVEMRVDVSAIVNQLNGFCNVSDFFIFRKSKDEVTDITSQSKVQLQGSDLVYYCLKFSEHVIGWTKFRRKAYEFIRGYLKKTFRVKFCPSASKEEFEIALSLLCHSDKASFLQHQCDFQHPSELHSQQEIMFSAQITSSEGVLGKKSSPMKVDRKICEKTGMLIDDRHFVGTKKLSSEVLMKVFQISKRKKEILVFSRTVKIDGNKESRQCYSELSNRGSFGGRRSSLEEACSGPARDCGKHSISSHLHQTIVEASASVARINWSNGSCGTGFRVGSRYLMTNYHVVKEPDVDSDDDEEKERRKYGRSCLFNFDRTFQEDDEQRYRKFRFTANPIIAWNKELDYAILECECACETPSLPKPINRFMKLGMHEYVIFAGHPKGEAKVVDYGCKVIHLDREELHREYRALSEWSQQTLRVNAYPKQFLDSRRVLYHVGKDFVGGSSGSPGMVGDAGQNACVAVLHAFQFPNLPPHAGAMSIPPDKTVEQGVRIEEIYKDLRAKHPVLCKEVFPGNEPK